MAKVELTAEEKAARIEAAKKAAAARKAAEAALSPEEKAAAAAAKAAKVARAKARAAVMKDEAANRKYRGWIVRWERLLIQLCAFLVMPGVWASCFTGVKYFFAQLGTASSVGLTSFVTLLFVVCAYTMVFGRFFCGYLCAFGFLNDVVYQLVDLPLMLLKVKRPQLPEWFDRVFRFLKFFVLAAICALAFMGYVSKVNANSPWTAFSQLQQLSVNGLTKLSIVLLGLCMVGMAFKERFFCEFLCPLGAVFSLMPQLPFFTMRRNEERCLKGCSACARNCPVGIKPQGDAALGGECIHCSRCLNTCPQGNILEGSYSAAWSKFAPARLKSLEEKREAQVEALLAQGPDAKVRRTPLQQVQRWVLNLHYSQAWQVGLKALLFVFILKKLDMI